MQYGPVTRRRQAYDTSGFPSEWPVQTAPVHRYVSVGGRGAGLTVFTPGVREYELTDDAIVMTLFRSVGELSRSDLAARSGNAAWPASTPGAQETGPFRADFGIAFCGVGEEGGPEDWDLIERLAEEFHAPAAGLMLRYGIDVPESIPGPELRGVGLAFKALKDAETGDAVVVRCVNLTTKAVNGVWKWPVPISRAARARLDESVIADLPVAQGGREIPFVARPREVVTIIVTPGG
jgi:alpha-mannosidase